MTDEKFVFVTDCADKKRTAWGVHNKTSHTGKGGRINFPSDYLTKEEREKMNGECVTYALNRPMKWKEHKQMPTDIRRQYIENLKTKYGVMQKDVAEMFGVSTETMRMEQKLIGTSFPKVSGMKANHNNGAWRDFCAGTVKKPEKPQPEEKPTEKPEEIKETPYQPEKPAEEVKEPEPQKSSVPSYGRLVVEDCSPVDALNAAFAVMGRAEMAEITVIWRRSKLTRASE